jgi:hypothetical protein
VTNSQRAIWSTKEIQSTFESPSLIRPKPSCSRTQIFNLSKLRFSLHRVLASLSPCLTTRIGISPSFSCYYKYVLYSIFSIRSLMRAFNFSRSVVQSAVANGLSPPKLREILMVPLESHCDNIATRHCPNQDQRWFLNCPTF